MQPIKFYKELPDMEITAGDTLPAFLVDLDKDLSGTRMFLVLARKTNPVENVLTVECTLINENTYKVQLTSALTKGLSEGMYEMHFTLRSPDGTNHYDRLRGDVYVHAAGGVSNV